MELVIRLRWMRRNIPFVIFLLHEQLNIVSSSVTLNLAQFHLTTLIS